MDFKNLAVRLKKVLPALTFSNQTTYVKKKYVKMEGF